MPVEALNITEVLPPEEVLAKSPATVAPPV